MKKRLVTVLVAIVAMTFTACGNNNELDNALKKPLEYKTYSSDSINAEVNKELFYRNDLAVEGADPHVIYISDQSSPEYGYYYMYATSDYLGGAGFLCWRSKNLADWENMGTAYKPLTNSWGRTSLWAPCVVFSGGKYYMYYSAHFASRKIEAIGLAVSEKPQGPFVQWTGTTADGRVITAADPFVDTQLITDLSGVADDQKIKGRTLIDANLFIDDDGKLYLYANNLGIWGFAMKDLFSPDYKSATQITRVNRSKAGSSGLALSDEAGCNEGAFMTKHKGKYYLTMSVNWFSGKDYSVKQAIGASPLDPNFEKVAADKGGMMLTAMEFGSGGFNTGTAYDFASGTGHHSLISVGNELYIVYHAHKNRKAGGGARAIAIDKVSFIEGADGVDIMYASAPSYSVQPLPTGIGGYKNVAADASITVKGSGEDAKKYLTDGIYKNHNYSFIHEAKLQKDAEITVEFASAVSLSAIMVYNSFDALKWFSSIKEIQIQSSISVDGTNHDKTYVIQNLEFDRQSHYNDEGAVARPGGAAIAHFGAIPAKSVKIIFDNNAAFVVSELILLGK